MVKDKKVDKKDAVENGNEDKGIWYRRNRKSWRLMWLIEKYLEAKNKKP